MLFLLVPTAFLGAISTKQLRNSIQDSVSAIINGMKQKQLGHIENQEKKLCVI